jgi:hypothetical protein
MKLRRRIGKDFPARCVVGMGLGQAGSFPVVMPHDRDGQFYFQKTIVKFSSLWCQSPAA